jgi:hypothetical protein
MGTDEYTASGRQVKPKKKHEMKDRRGSVGIVATSRKWSWSTTQIALKMGKMNFN